VPTVEANLEPTETPKAGGSLHTQDRPRSCDASKGIPLGALVCLVAAIRQRFEVLRVH
jgi:hypothetical protein